MTAPDPLRDPQVLLDVLEDAARGVFSINRHGVIVSWSERVAAFTGLPYARVVGTSCTFLESQGLHGMAYLADLLREPFTGASRPVDCTIEAGPPEERRRLHCRVRLIGDESRGEVTGALAMLYEAPAPAAWSRDAREPAGRGGTPELPALASRGALLKGVQRRIEVAARTDVTVLLTGESGTGKELAARWIHHLSGRRRKPIVAVNCSAIPEPLLESELFGHVKGAFTGAIRDKPGVFEMAEGGTLFLDEIGDTSPMIQIKLLRVLQDREYRRVGDERFRQADVRIITATNRDMLKLMAEEKIREDFYYRIRVFEIALPPLRERREDLPDLIRQSLAEFGARYRKRVAGVTPEALRALVAHAWPGNVRELRNVLESALVSVTGEMITAADLHLGAGKPRTAAPPPRPPVVRSENPGERLRIEEALAATGGNRSAAARKLGFSRVTLWKKIRQLGIVHPPA